MNKKILAPCGDRCDFCPRYTATSAGNEEALAEVAELWHRTGWRDRISAADMRCRGCGPSCPCTYDIRTCAADKGVPHCGSCGDYPCDKIEKTFKRSAEFEEICRARCTSGEFASLKKAFFEKRENLEGKL